MKNCKFLEIAICRAKRTIIWLGHLLGVLVDNLCLWTTFDLVVFNILFWVIRCTCECSENMILKMLQYTCTLMIPFQPKFFFTCSLWTEKLLPGMFEPLYFTSQQILLSWCEHSSYINLFSQKHLCACSSIRSPSVRPSIKLIGASRPLTGSPYWVTDFSLLLF